MEKNTIKRIIEKEIAKSLAANGCGYYVPVAVSNRHAHVTKEELDVLFGRGHKLIKLRNLNQPGQYACEEVVTLEGKKGRIENIRILGPVRAETQVEISLTDSFKVGIEPVIRMSGDLDGTSGCRLIGPKGEVNVIKGVIVSARHLHISAEEAFMFGLKTGDTVSVRKAGVRGIVFSNVIVRSGEGHSLEIHIDTDEANAAGITGGELLEIIR